MIENNVIEAGHRGAGRRWARRRGLGHRGAKRRGVVGPAFEPLLFNCCDIN